MAYGNDDFMPVMLGTNLNAYNLARSLHEAFGIRSLALGRYAVRETAHSRIIDARARPDMAQPQGILDALRDVAQEFPGRKLLLFPTIEYYTNVVLEHRDQLDERYAVPLITQAQADRLMNKSDFYRTCEQFGMPYPQTVVVAPQDPADPTLGADLPFDYPVILKPSNTDIYPRLDFEGKQKVYLVPDAEQLRQICSRIFAAGYDDDLVVQEYLAGDESVLRVANTYSDRHGRMRFASVGQVVLTEYDPALVGNNNAIVSIHDESLTGAMQAFLDGIEYTGLANFDFLYDHHADQYKLLEVNLRPGATSYYTMAGGGNLARQAVDDLIYERELPLTVTNRERLWLNVPYPVALRYAPASVRGRLRQAARAGTVHTLRYAPDMSRERRMDVARIDVRNSLRYLKYGGRRRRSGI